MDTLPTRVIHEYERIAQWNKINNPWLFDERMTKPIATKTSFLKNINAPILILRESPGLQWDKRAELKAKIRENQQLIREHIIGTHSIVIPRTQAHNRKCEYSNIEEEQSFRSDIVASQIRSWRNFLPELIKKFSKIKDPRRTKSVQHSLVMLMIFGLFAFVFRLSSRREMNRELTGHLIIEHLQKIFPELNSIPHADTLARLLEKINPQDIESAHIELVKSLIRKKKFKKLLIHNCLPITIDGTQKLFRDGMLQDGRWCERTVGNSENPSQQQYVYAIEANITLKNGLNIPLLSEYLYRSNNQMNPDDNKQDSETTAFERLAEKLKHYFPRQKIILFSDAMYATQHIMGIMHKNHWEYIIRLPKNKLKDLAARLNQKKSIKKMIPGQPYHRGRQQEFYWENYIRYGYEWQLDINLVGCLESYEVVNKETGEIEKHYSDHAWISSIPININNAHELCNLGARKKELIEDSINTEKNRGYRYKHAFSYDWNAMQGFHYLMRLGHAINALSEFTKKFKKYIRELGCSAALKLIKETIFSPWLPSDWYKTQGQNKAQLRFQLE